MVSFLDGSGPDNSGRYIEQVLDMDDSELEYNHDYIQWLFPLTEPSNAVPSSPALTDEYIVLIKDNLVIQDNLNMALDRMSKFYNYNDHWLTEYNHNHYRITRILKSISLLVSDEKAKNFHFKIIERINNSEDKVNTETIEIWKNIFN